MEVVITAASAATSEDNVDTRTTLTRWQALTRYDGVFTFTGDAITLEALQTAAAVTTGVVSADGVEVTRRLLALPNGTFVDIWGRWIMVGLSTARQKDWFITKWMDWKSYHWRHRTKNVVILTKVSLLASPEIVILTIPGATSDENFARMT